MQNRARERTDRPPGGFGRVHLRGEIRGLNSMYRESQNSLTIASSATHSPTNPSPSTGAKAPNHAKHGRREVKKRADMGLAPIQCCPGVPLRGVANHPNHPNHPNRRGKSPESEGQRV